MSCRGELKQGRSIGSNRGLKDDSRLSQLPNPLICQILSHLPPRDAVRTSSLATRWRSDLWLSVSHLKLDSREFSDFNDFVSFGDRFFDSNQVSGIQNLALTSEDWHGRRVDDGSFLTSWIAAVSKRFIQHLHVSCYPYKHTYEMPISLYICKTLVSLELHLVTLVNAEFVSLPRLKILQLSEISYPNEATFERLVSSCSILEELEIRGFYSDVKAVFLFRVRSKSLKRLITFIGFSRHDSSEIVIDAPRLCFLRIQFSFAKIFIITNMDSSVKLDIHFWDLNEERLLSERNTFFAFLPGISKVRDMIICRDTFELQVDFKFNSHSKWLPTFLQSFPNLQSLILVLSNNERMPSKEMSFSSVPDCLLSSLQFVDFKIPIMGNVVEMKLIRYFLENSVILKKLTLSLQLSSARDDILTELLRMPKGSPKCEVLVLDRLSSS